MTSSLQHHRRATGFTLLEMLVVLVLMGMLTALVAQAMGGLAAIDSSLERAQARAQRDYLAEHQLRTLVAGLVPDPGLDHALTGDNQQLSGLSLAALAARPGVPLPVRLAIEPSADGAALVIAGGTNEAAVAQRWPLGPGDWAWRYQDHDGQWHRSWPETPAEFAYQPQLPRAVALVDAASDTPRWLLAVPAHPTPRQEFFPVE